MFAKFLHGIKRFLDIPHWGYIIKVGRGGASIGVVLVLPRKASPVVPNVGDPYRDIGALYRTLVHAAPNKVFSVLK